MRRSLQSGLARQYSYKPGTMPHAAELQHWQPLWDAAAGRVGRCGSNKRQCVQMACWPSCAEAVCSVLHVRGLLGRSAGLCGSAQRGNSKLASSPV